MEKDLTTGSVFKNVVLLSCYIKSVNETLQQRSFGGYGKN